MYVGAVVEVTAALARGSGAVWLYGLDEVVDVGVAVVDGVG